MFNSYILSYKIRKINFSIIVIGFEYMVCIIIVKINSNFAIIIPVYSASSPRQIINTA